MVTGEKAEVQNWERTILDPLPVLQCHRPHDSFIVCSLWSHHNFLRFLGSDPITTRISCCRLYVRCCKTNNFLLHERCSLSENSTLIFCTYHSLHLHRQTPQTRQSVSFTSTAPCGLAVATSRVSSSRDRPSSMITAWTFIECV